MKYPVLFSVVVFLLSCHSKEEKADNNESIITPVSSNKQMTFFDSIYLKYDLSIEQVKAHTNLDSFYYSGFNSDAMFKGDTSFQLQNGFTGAIISYSDGKVCSKKLFFVFPAGLAVCSDHKEIEIDCDRELSSDYYYTRYKILGDSCIETTEYFMPPEKEGEEDISKVSEKINYKINQKGMIDTLSIKQYDH